MGKDKSEATKRKKAYSPLGAEIEKAQQLPVRKRAANKKGQERDDDEGEGREEKYLPKALSARLLRQVKQQQAEVEEDESDEGVRVPAEEDEEEAELRLSALGDGRGLGEDAQDDMGAEDEDEDAYYAAQEGEIAMVDAHEEALMEMFMRPAQQGSNARSLDIGQLILHKMKEKEQALQFAAAAHESAHALSAAAQGAGGNGGAAGGRGEVDPKVVAVYGQIGALLKAYRSGRLPKAMKILPMIENWEELLFLTRPEEWSPHAAGALTKIYASNFTDKMAQRFYVLVLLPLVRADIRAHKKLNFHLYMALKKALYKPAAWYKGILLPLCEAGNCSLLEATIVGSVLRKVSVPVLPSAVALLKLAAMPYNGAISQFMRTLIDKRYALPYRVLDALVAHFLAFRGETRQLPVVWHQALLALAQRYKEDVTAEQKHELKLLLREKSHHAITPEVRRELFSTKSRGEGPQGAPELRRMNAVLDLSDEDDAMRVEDDDAMED